MGELFSRTAKIKFFKVITTHDFQEFQWCGDQNFFTVVYPNLYRFQKDHNAINQTRSCWSK